MESIQNIKIFYEPRFDLRPDMAIVETFHDGSQLIRQRGKTTIINSCKAGISNYMLQANVLLFSNN